MKTCCQLLYIFAVTYTVSTFGQECSKSLKSGCRVGNFCIWLILHSSAFFMIAIIEHLISIFLTIPRIYSILRTISEWNFKIYYCSFGIFCYYYLALFYDEEPIDDGSHNQSGEGATRSDTSLQDSQQEEELSVKSGSCGLTFSLRFSTFYFDFFFLVFICIIALIVFSAVKDCVIRSRRETLKKKFKKVFESIYTDPKSVERFYAENMDWLAPQDLLQEELDIYKDLFSVDLASSPEPKYNVCSICLGEFEEGEKVVPFPGCHHNFHYECLEAWIRKRKTCPVCKKDFRENFASEVIRKLENSFVKEGFTEVDPNVLSNALD